MPLAGEAKVCDLEHRVCEVVVLDGLQDKDWGVGRKKGGSPHSFWAADQVSWPLPQLESPTCSLPHLELSIPLPTVAPFLVWNIVDPSLQSNPCPRLP